MAHSVESNWLDSTGPFSERHSIPLMSYVHGQFDDHDVENSDPMLAFNLLSRIIQLRAGYNGVELSSGKRLMFIGEGSTYTVQKSIVRNWKEVNGKIVPLATVIGEMVVPEEGRIVAVKQAKSTIPKGLPRQSSMDTESLRNLKAVVKELEIFAHPPLKAHPSIPSLFGFEFDLSAPGLAPSLVMEYADFGSLNSLFRNTSVSEEEKIQLCLDIATGIEALHECMIVHGDVKQDNVLVFPSAERRFVAKISDFEHALYGSTVQQYRGTLAYTAPEIHEQRRGEAPSSKVDALQLFSCDAFAYGLLTLEIFNSGMRYYDLEGGRLLQNGISALNTEFDDVLAPSLLVLRLQTDLPSHSTELCTRILEQTLRSDPRLRLRNGWSAVKKELGYTTSSSSSSTREASSSGLQIQPHRGQDYSILSFLSDIFAIGESAIGGQILHDLEHAAQSGSDRLKMGKASFELCLVYSSGRIQSPMTIDEALLWLANAASLGHETARLIGRRIFEANGQAQPSVISQHYPEEILVASPSKYYSEAVRCLLSKELRTRLSRRFQVKEFDGFNDLYGFARSKCEQLNIEFLDFVKQYELLHFAICLQNKDIAELLLGAGAPVNARSSDGLTPLHLACQIADFNLVDMLLAAGANPRLEDRLGITPLHWIILFPENRIRPFTMKLKNSGCDLNAITKTDSKFFFDDLGLILCGSPLVWSVLCQNHAAVSLLLEYGANPLIDHPDDSSRFFGNAYLNAAGIVSAEMLELLLSTSRAPNRFSDTEVETLYAYVGAFNPMEFHRWCLHGSEYTVAYAKFMGVLSSNGYQLVTQSKLHSFPLTQAILRCDFRAVEQLIVNGIRVDQNAKFGHVALRDALIANDADISSPFRMAKTIEILLDHGANAEPLHPREYTRGEQYDLSILQAACFRGVPGPVIRLLANRLPHQINEQYCHPCENRLYKIGRTALHYLMASNSEMADVTTAKILLSLGADPDIETYHQDISESVDRAHSLPLAYWSCCRRAVAAAIENLNWSLMKLYLDCRVSIAMGGAARHRYTILHLAVLQALHAKHNGRGNSAERERNVASFIDLMLNHAYVKEVNLRDDLDYAGISPLSYSIRWGLESTVEVLLKHGTRNRGWFPQALDVLDFSYSNPPAFVKSDEEFVKDVRQGFLGASLQLHRLSDFRRSLDKISCILKDSNTEASRLYEVV